ncbi:hypothetical protein EYB33_00755 (plasmid) [Lysinibacillus sphaericus]|nr:hypothetical protein EYB33_00150 [Lysinibacillus sphaericus]UDK94938.1 hypothetical protein EYB33_00755 [Lysinibacillus sphaericus]
MTALSKFVDSCPKKYFAALYKDLKQQFQVLSYKDIPRNAMDEALAFIRGWVSPKLVSGNVNEEVEYVEC